MNANFAVLDPISSATDDNSRQIDYTRPLIVATYTENALLNPSGIAHFVEGGWAAWIDGWIDIP